MKNFYLILVIIFFNKSNAQFTSIPDENFEQELINQNIDSDGIINHLVLNSDINTRINLVMNSSTAANIVTLTGIEGFTLLEELSFFSAGSLQLINLELNQNLKKIVLINPQISNLNISNNLDIETLYLYYCNNLTTINLLNNTHLKDLAIGNFNLSVLILTNNINLEKIRLNYTQISQLDISNNIALNYIYLLNNPLVTIDVSNNLNLEYLYLASSNVANINLSQNSNLKYLSLYINQIQNLDTSFNTLLEELGCSNNLLVSLNLNSNTFLNKMNCKNYIGFNQNNIASLYLQNSSNYLLNGLYDIGSGSIPPTYNNRFDSTNNPNLYCIFVDDVANCNDNWLGKDVISNYVSTQQECSNLQNEEFITNSFSIYPNPVNDILYIENTNNNEIQKVTIYNLLGKIVTEQNGNDSQLNFTNIARGLYLVKITTEKEIIIKKIVKK